MKAKAARQVKARNAKARKGRASAKPAAVVAASAPVLGTDVKGELLDVALAKVIDPAGPSDRMARPDDDERIASMARSMNEVGQLQPVMLERLADGRFCRVFGRRRIAAARLLGWTNIRAVVVPPLADNVRRTVVAVENVQRLDLTPAEETLAVDELMQLQALVAAKQLGKPLNVAGGLAGKVITSDMILAVAQKPAALKAWCNDALLDPRVRNLAASLVSAMLAKSETWVRDRMYIGRLDETAKKLVLEGKLPLAHAREIAKVADPAIRSKLAKSFAAGGPESLSDQEPGSLDDLRREVQERVFSLATVPWRLDVPVGPKPACSSCPANSANCPGLFEHGGRVSEEMRAGQGVGYGKEATTKTIQQAGVCVDHRCYAEKLRLTEPAIASAAKKLVDGKPRADVKVAHFVSDGALGERVRVMRERSKNRGRSTSQSKAAATREAKARAEREAQYKLAELLEQRCRTAIPTLVAKLREKPGRLALFVLMQETPLWHKNHYEKPRDSEKKQWRDLLAMLATDPTVDSLVRVEAAMGVKYEPLSPWSDKNVIDDVAAALGVELPPKPTIADVKKTAGKHQDDEDQDDEDQAENDA
ncbi:MAG: ParB N-terminal domain-containing protein [Planctomycetota bacterium]|nr:ParB N-terminal domain-containing protein [Planctomycetota bacterium]